MSSTTLRSSLPITLSVMASRVLGLVREMILLALFPVALTDAYRIAFQIPNLLRDLLAEGALSSAFVPTFSAALEQGGRVRAQVLSARVLTAVLLLTGFIVLFGMIFTDPLVVLISDGFAGDAAKLKLTVRLTRWMLPMTALFSVGAVLMGMLNAQSRFALPALASAIFNVVNIVGGAVLFWFSWSPEAGVVWFAIATVIAALVQVAVQIPALVRTGFRPALTRTGIWSDPGVQRIARLMAPAVIGLAAIQVNVFVNVRFASALGDGPVTYLTSAFRLFYLPVGLFGVALATVTTARVSQEAARGDRSALAARAAEGQSAVWMLATASAVGLIVLADPVATLVFARGAFTAADAHATAQVLQMYMLGVVPYSLVKGLAPAFYAIDRPRIPMLASVCAVVVNVTFNVLTVEYLGAPGLALGTTVGAFVNYGVLRFAFWRLVGPLPRYGAVSTARRVAALVVANGVLAILAMGVTAIPAPLSGALGLAPSAFDRGLMGAIFVAVTIGAGFLGYTFVLKLFGYPGASSLWSLPAKLLQRVREAPSPKAN